jgi:hypothetical protein
MNGTPYVSVKNIFHPKLTCTPPQVTFSNIFLEGEYRSVLDGKYFSLKHRVFHSFFCADSEYGIYFV